MQILSPDVERDGWHSPRSVLMFVTDDIPFLVDTVRLVLDRHDLGIHLLVHPTLIVTRDADGVITAVRPPAGASPTSNRDPPGRAASSRRGRRSNSIVARPTSPTSSSVRWSTAIAAAHQVVDDFDEMQARLLDVADGDPLLVWLGVENLVLLGAATYRRTDDGLALDRGQRTRAVAARGRARRDGRRSTVESRRRTGW